MVIIITLMHITLIHITLIHMVILYAYGHILGNCELLLLRH